MPFRIQYTIREDQEWTSSTGYYTCLEQKDKIHMILWPDFILCCKSNDLVWPLSCRYFPSNNATDFSNV